MQKLHQIGLASALIATSIGTATAQTNLPPLPPWTITLKVNGSGPPIVRCEVYNFCTVFLAPSEHFDDATPYLAGDTARFKIRTGHAGGLDCIAFKPISDDNPDTMVQLNTDQGVRFIHLVGVQKVERNIYRFPPLATPTPREANASAAFSPTPSPTPQPTYDPSISYTTNDRASFAPLKVWSDGSKVYLVLPARIKWPTILGLDKSGHTYPLQIVTEEIPNVIEIVGVPDRFEMLGGANRGDEAMTFVRRA